MEPLDLTCPKCNATWKLIKAEGAIACPYCKADVDSPSITSSSATTEPVTVPSVLPATTETPVESAAASEASPQLPASVPHVPFAFDSTPSFARQARQSMDDADDSGVRADYDDRYEVRRRSGMHPLLKVFIILLILFILVPVAAFVLIAVVCAVG